MEKNIFINFCLRQHPDYGGSYTAQALFRRALNSYFIDLSLPHCPSPSEADYTIPGSVNPFFAFLKSRSVGFFDFIPHEVKNQTVGIIAHSAFLSQFSYAFQLSRHLGVPLYLVPHGTTDPYVFSYSKIKKRIWLNAVGKPAVAHARNIIFSTEAEQRKSVFPFSHVKGAICPFSVDPPQINRTDCRRFLRQKFGLGEDDRIAIYFSKIDKFKRPLETIRAFLNIRPKGWKLLVIGYSEDDDLREEVGSYSTDPDILIHPPVFGEEKWQYLAGADLFVLFSHRENFGFSVVEAACLGIPVYISKGVDIYPFFGNEQQKMVFDIKSQQDIERAFKRLSQTPSEILDTLGIYCRSTVLESFTFDKFSDNLMKILLPGTLSILPNLGSAHLKH